MKLQAHYKIQLLKVCVSTALAINLALTLTAHGQTSQDETSSAGHHARKGEVVAEGQEFESNYYLNRLEIFRRSFAQQISNYTEQIKEFPQITSAEKGELIQEAEMYRDIMDAKILQFKENYQSRYIDLNTAEEIKLNMWQSEGDIKWSIEKSFVAMIDILDALEEGKGFRELGKSRQIIQSNGDAIRRGQLINPSLADTIRKVTPMKKGLLKTICAGSARICINQDLTTIIKETPTDAYARVSSKPTEYSITQSDGTQTEKFPSLPSDAIVFFVMNHDHAALDARYLMEVADRIGVDRNLILTTASAWPHFEQRKLFGMNFSIFKNKDPHITLKEETNPTFKQRALNFFQENPAKRVAFSIFPEGELPFWGIQFPLFSNWGAFKLARKAAVEWKGKRPVYMIEIHANFLTYVTATDDSPIKIEIIEPTLVPTDEITDRDPWMEERRLEFEKRANRPDRRGQMYDLIDRRLIPGGRINTVEPVRRYIPRAETGSLSCESILEGI